MPPRESNARGASFSKEEDKALCKAWIKNATDEVTGTWQTYGELWNNVCSTYYSVQTAEQWEERTEKSLECRWKKIQTSCNLWRGSLGKADLANISGQSEVDVLRAAKQLYRNRAEQKEFKMEHCWDILKKHSKWSLQRSRHFEEESNNDAQTQNANLGDDLDGTSRGNQGREASSGRPEGRSGTRSRRSSFAESAPLLKEMVDNSRRSREMMETQRQENQAFLQHRNAISMEKLQMERERNFEAKRAADRVIMNMNTADMTPLSKQYYTDQKKEILRSSQVQRGTARSLFSEPTGEGSSSQAYQHSVSHSDIPHYPIPSRIHVPPVNDQTYTYSNIHSFDSNDVDINYNTYDEGYNTESHGQMGAFRRYSRDL